jgi:hypothetical protein
VPISIVPSLVLDQTNPCLVVAGKMEIIHLLLMFTPARLAVGLEPLSVPGVMRRKPHPFRNAKRKIRVPRWSHLIATIWQTNCSQYSHPTPQSK